MDAAKPKRAAAKATKTFTADEAEAMEERSKEMKAARGKAAKADGEGDVLAKIAAMTAADRTLAERIHALVKANAPELSPKTWYGMPAYANSAGKIICFFQPSGRFKTRYSTLGFNDAARLDDGNMWPVAFALTKLAAADEARIGELVKKAAG